MGLEICGINWNVSILWNQKLLKNENINSMNSEANMESCQGCVMQHDFDDSSVPANFGLSYYCKCLINTE